VSDTKGKSVTKELKDNDANSLLGLEIGKETDASVIGFKGKITITGGSDKSGVPMRADVHGSARKYVLLSRGVGLPKIETGQRARKLVRGNSVSEEIYQINCKLDGELPVDTTKSEKDQPSTEEKPEEKKA
jgi:small subunit ribosomal protein S6e